MEVNLKKNHLKSFILMIFDSWNILVRANIFIIIQIIYLCSINLTTAGVFNCGNPWNWQWNIIMYELSSSHRRNQFGCTYGISWLLTFLWEILLLIFYWYYKINEIYRKIYTIERREKKRIREQDNTHSHIFFLSIWINFEWLCCV